ncbi:MAG: carbamoyltransferase HypF [Roseiarcus sp.]|uniref:carbamoyltransferase HypF n=1 Tax=Roseiarcus sp. TaxID=1969460 RepID=UPI003BB21408
MTLLQETRQDAEFVAMEIRVRGRVQGVGFRPTVWRIARELDLAGEVLNDGEGVLARVRGSRGAVQDFIVRLESEPPPLARIDQIETRVFTGALPSGFRIAESLAGDAHTEIAPDAAICAACAQEIVDPFQRRFRYPFANCTHCGPRLSIVKTIPYDRANTTMSPFAMCEACEREYRSPADRRFHAEAIACHACGPSATLIRLDGRATRFDQHSLLDDVDTVRGLIARGEIVAIKGLGGFHLACDATNAEVVARLRQLKRRDAKPFALMARDLDVVRRYCSVGLEEERALASAAAPIVLLRADRAERLPDEVAPGLATLGFMLPTTPLHLLILARMERPVVMTSGNVSEEPQVIDEETARTRLGGIATYALTHDREIANRVDDSVTRVLAGRIRVSRRARGFAPAPIALPPGFEAAPELLAMGGELKATFCLVKDGEAILSQHQGDLENVETFDDYRKNLRLYAELFDHAPRALVADRHPEYLSSKLAREWARAQSLPLIEAQHHHAHVAACLAENDVPLDSPSVLGIVLDGLGWGDDGTVWGGEFLLADYRGFERLGAFKPVSMLGGAQAAHEPWRNLYAHLMAEMGWAEFSTNFAELELHADLARRPRATLDAMVRAGVNSPRASSCGRLFDAVAAALNVCRERQAYEGEAGARLEAIVDLDVMSRDDEESAYPFAIADPRDTGLPCIEPLAMWRALLGDLILKTPAPLMSARFHKGLARIVVAMAKKLARRDEESGARFDTVALSGGCFQNRVLFEEIVRRLEQDNFTVLTHAKVPANDGGLALGQAAIGAARLIDEEMKSRNPGRTKD